MEREKRLFSGTLLLGISAAFGKIVSLCLLPFFTSALTPSAFGVTEIFISIAALLMPLASLYAPQATFRFLAQGERAAVRTGAILLGSGLLLFAGFIPLVGRFEILRPYRFLLYFYVCASLLRSFLAHILRARGCFGIYALQQSFCAILTATLQALFLVATPLGAAGYLLGILLGDGATFLILLFCFFPFSEKGEVPTRALRSKMLRYALPLMPAALLWWTMGAVEKYVLLYYHGEASMGIYAVAGRFPALIGFATGIFLEVWHYAALQSSKESEGELFGRVYALLLPFAIGVGVGVSALSPWLISVALASGYADAARVVGLLSLGAVCAGLSCFLDSIYTLRFRTGYSFFTAFLAAGVNVLLSFLLVPRWGIVGAAASGALSFSFLFAVRLWQTSRLLPFSRYEKRSTLSLLFLLIGGLLMASKYTAFATVMVLISLLPVITLFLKAQLFLYKRVRAFLSGIRKNSIFSSKKRKT